MKKEYNLCEMCARLNNAIFKVHDVINEMIMACAYDGRLL